MKKAIRFSAAWCQPCKQYEKHWNAVSGNREDWTFEVIDVDTDPENSFKYGIRSIPTTIFENDGELLDRKSGVLTEVELHKMLDQLQ